MIKSLMTLAAICIVLALLVDGSARAETNKAPDPILAKKGLKLYETYCQRCHQKNGVGEPFLPWGIRHPDDIPAMPLNETSHAWHHSDEQLRQTVLHGIPGRPRMPAFQSVLTEQQADALVAYIKSLWSEEIIACQGPRHMSCMGH